jgi:hypothetical protein
MTKTYLSIAGKLLQNENTLESSFLTEETCQDATSFCLIKPEDEINQCSDVKSKKSLYQAGMKPILYGSLNLKKG